MSFLVLTTMCSILAISGILMLVVSYLNDVKKDRMIQVSSIHIRDEICTFNYTTRWFPDTWFECAFPTRPDNTTCDFIQPTFFYIGRGFENKHPDPSQFQCFNVGNNVARPTVNLVMYILGSIFCLPLVIFVIFIATVVIQTIKKKPVELDNLYIP
jgi:hypothetical protein